MTLGFKKFSLKKASVLCFAQWTKVASRTRKKKNGVAFKERKSQLYVLQPVVASLVYSDYTAARRKIRNWYMYKQCWWGAMSDNLWNQSGVISTELHQFMGGDIIPSCINASNLLDHKVGATKQNVILILNSVVSPLTGALR